MWRARSVQVDGGQIPDSGHFIPEEQPGRLVEAILAFVG